MAENFEKTAEKLASVMVTKVLGEPLFNQVAEYFEILDSRNSIYEQKNYANVLAENLLSQIKDLPDIDIGPKRVGR